ncbi:hypothetical protein TL16_g04540 [Triparma laevis f. inornata]|uniref:Uncharacterized protein n=1 Tax=Triparma laevis f. inornata TaxID=1714386 RepID=A0A9W7AAV5_9STRA|nr:hypothetical protein TL16_g04540 [Triparma laevis f. inornata]
MRTAALSRSLDYGYSQTDTDECCLSGYFDNDDYWKPLMHFRTSDGLYRVHGGYMGSGEDNPGEYFLVGSALSTDYSVIGEAKNLTSFTSYFCDDSGLQLKYHCASDKYDDEACSAIKASSIPQFSGCQALPADSVPMPIYYELGCAEDRTPTETIYLDSDCQNHYQQSNLDKCTASTTFVEKEGWAGGYMRETTVAVFIGVMTNKIGHSSFHNIYLPDFSTYNDQNATSEKNFNEVELIGSTEQYGEGFEDVFAAQFGRECLSDDSKYCRILREADLASGSLLDFMSRQYLDPTTGLGTDKDYLRGHRVLIFDKAN